MGLLIPIAFLAGVVTAISPCVLPVLPVAMAGAVTGGKRRPAGVVTGFVVTLVLFTLALTKAFEAIGLSATGQRNLGVALLLLFAATMIIPAFGERVSGLLAPLQRLGSRLPKGGDGFLGGVAMGLGLGLVWAPCAGPVFSAVAAANASDTAGASTWVVLFSYALGAALPMLAIMFGGQRLARRFTPKAVQVRAGMGVLLAATGVLIFTGADTRFTAWVVDAVPSYTDTLQAAERTAPVRDALDGIQGRTAPGVADATPRPPAPGVTPTENPEIADALPPESPAARQLQVYAPAPEFTGLGEWFNGEGTPRTLKELRGRVVLIDFWTYSCVNCIRTLPHIRAWDRAYRDRGLTIVGVHTPEFAFEKEPANVRKAIRDLGVTWPVALDSDYGTWNAWGNRYWPAKYLIDRNGDVRAFHFGEGAYDETEDQIRALLGYAGPRAKDQPETGPVGHVPQTPESYLGAARMDRFDSRPAVETGKAVVYAAPATLPDDHLAYRGQATVGEEEVTAGKDFSIELAFRGQKVFLVLGGAGKPLTGQVLLDGKPIPPGKAGRDVGANGSFTVTDDRLYDLVDLGARGTGRLSIRLAPGTRGYAFTFG